MRKRTATAHDNRLKQAKERLGRKRLLAKVLLKALTESGVSLQDQASLFAEVAVEVHAELLEFTPDRTFRPGYRQG